MRTGLMSVNNADLCRRNIHAAAAPVPADGSGPARHHQTHGEPIMRKRNYPLSKVYGLLEPGPVVLLSTSHKGRANVMTMSWHTMMEFEPPLVGCVVSDRDYSFRALKATRECVINIPTAELAAQVVDCGNTTGDQVDKFDTFGLTPVPGGIVAAPLIAECYASLECRAVDTRLVNRYAFFVLEVVKAWVDTSCKQPKTLHHRGYGQFMLAGETIALPSKMR
jgi:flavin reductase (DIM6/NTAB) family NADH-FMN oxidoreductase RutF